MINRYVLSSLVLAGLVQPACAYDIKARVDLEPLIVKHAAANNVPPALVHRIIIRESRYNPRAVGRGGALGLMQIKHGTARALGYAGPPAGLLDANTNLTYGVRYLAGAYRVANGDQNRAVGYYARGYYYDAKRRGLHGALAKEEMIVEEPAPVAVPAPQPQQPPSLLTALFSPPRSAEPVAIQQVVVEEPESLPAGRRSSRSARSKPSPANRKLASTQPEGNRPAVQPAAVAADPERAPQSGPSAKPKRGFAAISSAQPADGVAPGPAQQGLSREEALVAPKQGNRVAKQKAAKAGAGQSASAQQEVTQGPTQVLGANSQATETKGIGSGGRALAGVSQAPKKSPARSLSEEADAAMLAGAEQGVRQNSHPAKRKAAAGANHSAQKVSEPPADPGRVP